MLKKVAAVLLICAAELVVLFLLRPSPPEGMEAVQLNALVHAVENAGGDFTVAATYDAPDFSVTDANGRVLFSTSPTLPGNPLQAAASGYAVLPLELADGVGALIVDPQSQPAFETRVWTYFWLATAAVGVSGAIMLAYLFRIDRRIVEPFRNARRVAEEIARGNLDFPLRMDRDGVFGAFTEAFDLMRSSLRQAREAEAAADAAKKELIAKLSHDLRTPLASIQAVAEVGALTASGNDRRRFEQIAGKTVQLHLLVSNLLNASLGEETGFVAAPRVIASAELRELLEGADYRQWLDLAPLPDSRVFCDPVRLQQIFDNIIANAYKYGRAPLRAAGFVTDGELFLEFEDSGGGVDDDEISSLPLRYFRGNNAGEASGAGLGLYICDQLLRVMGGELLVRNGEAGLQVTVILPLASQAAFLRKS